MKKQIIKIGKKLWSWVAITFGCVISAVGYVLFILPMDMVEGGSTGVGIIVQHLTGLPIVGTTSLLITSVLFIVGTRILGKGFGVKSIYAATLMNILIDILLIMKLPQITEDMLLAAFYGGAIVGFGLGIIYFYGASTGGADALGQILWKLKKIRIGRTLLTVDVFVLGAATAIFIPLEKLMYSLIFIFIELFVIDKVLNGIQANQRIMIVTDKPEEMKTAIFEKLNRGITIFKGTGGYTGNERYLLTSVLPQKNIPSLYRIVSEVDDGAFVIVHNVSQVYGEGFERLPRRK